jgi:hypothetical protein
MKLSELKKLIREEVRKVVREAREDDITQEDIIDRFENYDIVVTNFDLKAAARAMGMPEQSAAIVIQNLEDDDIMKDLAKGNYKTIDPHEFTQFNDEYDYIYKRYKIGRFSKK